MPHDEQYNKFDPFLRYVNYEDNAAEEKAAIKQRKHLYLTHSKDLTNFQAKTRINRYRLKQDIFRDH